VQTSSPGAEVNKSTEGQSILWKSVISRTGNSLQLLAVTEPGYAILTSAGQSM